jgi:hypothetical protein
MMDTRRPPTEVTMLRYSTIGGDDALASEASALIEIACRLPPWDEVTIYTEAAQSPRASLSWHEGYGVVFHCFEDEQSSRFFLAEAAELSPPEVDIVLGGQVQERWPPEVFVSLRLGLEAVDHFLKTGMQKESLHWIGTNLLPRETAWEGRAGYDAWARNLRGDGERR